MNSEITNVSKLVPATVVKSNRQSEEPAFLKSDAVTEPKVEAVPADGLKRESGSSVTALDTLKSAAVAGNSILQTVNRNLEFQVDDSTKKVVVKIVDNQSGETVRQIPTEDMMTFIKKMQELDGKTGSVIQDRA
jgi:flagellar protein FlaG